MLLSIAARIPAAMPLVPLFDETAAPQSSHQVRAPGGYESWRIAAFDPKQDLLLYAAIHEGSPLDAAYVRAFCRYLARPTRRPPPLPQEYRCEELAVYHRGQRIAHSFTRLNSAPQPITTVSELHVGQCKLSVTTLPPTTCLDENTFNSSHHWLVSTPLVRVSGQLHLPQHQFPLENILACRDHVYGSARPKLKQFVEGIIFFPDSAILFQATPTTSWIVHAASDRLRVIDQPLTMDSTSSISIPDHITLTNPRIVDRSPFRQRILYEGKSAHAFCDISYPHRLAWPLIGLLAPHPQPGQPVLTAADPPA